jgi:hypothetical protein
MTGCNRFLYDNHDWGILPKRDLSGAWGGIIVAVDLLVGSVWYFGENEIWRKKRFDLVIYSF